MSLQLAAQHLASKGRGPDTTLVHMAPGEVASLQAIARAHGGSLSVNPQTGLPEAGFLSSILPMIAGAFLGPAGMGLSALQSGLAAGALTGLATGSLKKGLMAGLGAYGGAGIGGVISGAGAAAGQTVPMAGENMARIFPEATGAAVPQVPIQNIPMASMPDASFLQPSAGVMAPGTPIETPVTATQTAPTTSMPTEVAAQPAPQQFNKYDQFKAGLGAVVDKPSLLFNKENMKYGLAAAAPLLMAEPEAQKPKKDTQAYSYSYDPGRTDEPLGGPYMGERTYFRPSYTRLAAEGGSMSSQYDYVYNPETQLYERKKEDIAATPKDGMPAGIRTAGEGPSTDYAVPGDPSHPLAGLLSPIGAQIGNAINGVAGFFGGQPVIATGDNTVVGYDPGAFGVPGAQGTPGLSSDSLGLAPGVDTPSSDSSTSDVGAASAGADAVTYAYGGLSALARGGYSHLGDYSDGGRLLRGPGDGVSDSIPATIADKRPARLANNEFVIPARIVSEIGNGSTDAGARRLYAMMDRVQKRRAKTVGKGKVAVDSGAHKEVDAL